MSPFRNEATQLQQGTTNDSEDITGQTPGEKKSQISIKDRVAAAEERGKLKITSGPNQKDPLEKYTTIPKDDNLVVHHPHPMAALSDIDHNLIGEWENLPEGKLLAQPFGDYAAEQKNHGKLRSLIFGAVVEITNAHKVTVCAPQQNPSSNKMPISFLIYDLTETQKKTLLDRGIWSSSIITFRVMPLEPTCPNYLFTIKDLTTKTTREVYEAVHEVWHDKATSAALDAICNNIQEDQRNQAAQALIAFVNSMWVTILETKKRGNIADPSFHVFATGNIIDEDCTWCYLRNYFASREYKIKFQEPGTNIVYQHTCSLCHGADHPHGLCPFPKIKGWNGPIGKEDLPLNSEQEWKRVDATSSRDRNRTKMARMS